MGFAFRIILSLKQVTWFSLTFTVLGFIAATLHAKGMGLGSLFLVLTGDVFLVDFI